MKLMLQRLCKTGVASAAVAALFCTAMLSVGASSSVTGEGVVGSNKLTSEDVDRVDIEPIEIIENTYGDWQVYWDEETREDIDYYCYNWSAFINFTITLKNGDVIDASDGYFTYEGINYPLMYSHSHQRYENRWLVGNTYTVEHTILGEVYEIPVTIVESPVSSIRCDSEEIVIREGTYCDLLPDGASELYQYRWYEAASWTVTYVDGREETTYDRIVEIDGHNYAFEFTDAQATLQNWTAGNTYTGYAEFLGAECDVDVRITDSFIQNIVFDPIYVYANADGLMNTQYDPELGRDREYFRYNWSQFLTYTATLFDGTVIEGTGDYLYYDGEYYGFETADTQSWLAPWLAGQSYPVQIAVLGETYTAGVRVVANPVADIEFPNIVIPQGLYGETVEEYDALLNQTFTYFEYDVSKFFDYVVLFADGTTAEATYSGFRYDNRSYGARIVGGMQHHNNVWKPGEVYHITVNVMGTELVIPAYIEPIPEAEGFGYTRNYDGTVSIRECGKTGERLTIPSTIGEYTVTEIQSIDIAEEYITEIVIPKSVERLSWCDFTAFPQLTTIYYEGSEDEWRDISHCYTGYDGLTIVYNHVTQTPPDSITDLVYAIIDGEVTITDCGTDIMGELVIPETIQGYPVTTIGDGAFIDCAGLTSLVLSAGVTEIGYDAFRGCTGLESIAVDEQNTEFHSAGNCLIHTASGKLVTGCKNSVIPSDGTVKSIGDRAFYCCDVQSVEIPDSVTDIGQYAFVGCKNLSFVKIGKNVTELPEGAFYLCDKLASITIPASVETIGDFAFKECSDLISVEISDGVTSIGEQAFWQCESLTKITIPDSVTNVGDYAFYKCQSLTSITLGRGIQSIRLTVFTLCDNLREVWYTGTQEQRNTISCGKDGAEKDLWGSDLLTQAVWHYNTCAKDHAYTNGCDSSCNVCGWVRVTLHTYGGDCGAVCNTCGETRNVTADHTYTDKYDFDCNVCGYIREIVLRNGWVLESDGWQYYKDDVLQTGWLRVNGFWYFLDESGVMQTGWLNLGGTWYYLNEGGVMVTGWLNLGGTWYYLNEGGAMATGWLNLGGTWYYLNEGGAMATGWLNLGGTWYYLNEGGAMATGWLDLGGTWYYLHESGAMATNTVTIGNVTYWFNDSGVWIA